MSFIKKQYDIDQPAGFTLLTGGPSLALGGKAVGPDKLSETNIVQVTSGQFPSPNNTLSESNIVTVV